MTVKEFIKWLKKQDQEAIIECVVHDKSGGYYEQGGTATLKEFAPDLSDYTDFRGNQFVKPDAPNYNKRFLLIGESE